MKGLRRKFFILATMVMMLLISVTGEAAFTAKRKGVNYPTTIKAGQVLSIKGTVTANEKIAKAAVTIYNSTGKKCLQRYTTNPNSKVFNIASADSSIEFNKLASGKYYYRVSIYNAAGKKIAIVNRKFTVKAAAPTITKTGITVPGTLKAGTDFNMAGTIKTSFTMKSAVFTIYNSTGKKCLQRYKTSVNGTTYDIKKADPHLVFTKLAKGTYYYRISIYNKSDKKYRIVDKKFTVAAAPVSTIKITNPLPSKNIELNEKAYYYLGGKITSSYNLTSITGTLVNSAGKEVYTKTVTPVGKSFELKDSQIDEAMHFEKLSGGTYTLKVTAKDSSGVTAIVMNRTITVKGSSSYVGDDVQIRNVVPSVDIALSAGKAYGLGGIITGKTKLTHAAVTLVKADSTVVVSKGIDLNTQSYAIGGGALDLAVRFEILPKGTYTLNIYAKDATSSAERKLVSRKIVIQ